jgi:potassium-dependent mechanosensitive channel
VLAELEEFLYTHLVTLNGVPVTVASLLTCLLVVVGALVLGKLAASAARTAILRRGRPQGAAIAAGRIAWYSIVATGLFVALDTVGFSLTAVLAGSAVLLVGIGFGLQNLAQNFISGLILLLEQPVKEGDFIRVGGIDGEVKRIGLRATHVISRDEVTVIVPNSELVAGQVVNHSIPTANVRIWVKVRAALGSDTAKVARLLDEVAAADPGILCQPAPEIRFEDFGESSLDFALFCWIPNPKEDLRTMSHLRFAIDAAFRAGGITIPFPQRDLHLRSNDAGLRG